MSDKPTFSGPDGAYIEQMQRSGFWYAFDQYDWFDGPYISAEDAAMALARACKEYEDNYEPNEADLRAERMSARSDGEVRHEMEQAKRLK